MEVMHEDFRRQKSDLLPWACQRRPPGDDIGNKPRSVSALGGQCQGDEFFSFWKSSVLKLGCIYKEFVSRELTCPAVCRNELSGNLYHSAFRANLHDILLPLTSY